MCIDRMTCADLEPSWEHHPGNRYLVYASLRLAFVQLLAEPGAIYVVSDQPLPETFERAVAAIVEWRASDVQAAA